MNGKIIPAIIFLLIGAIFGAGAAVLLFRGERTETDQAEADKQKVESKPPPQPTVHTLSAAGDILLSRLPERALKTNGFDSIFSSIRDLTGRSDIFFANLENPVSFLGAPYPGKPPVVTFRAPPGAVLSLLDSGIDVVSLANNHTNDYGPDALRETLKLLETAGIQSCGAGINRSEALEPVIFDLTGATGSTRVAFLAFADPIWSVVPASDREPGVAILEEEEVITAIRQTKSAYSPDLLLVSIHWGIEHKHLPEESQTVLARKFIDAGAEVILGHHPHVIQPIELYNGGVIFYSFGNFVFDMEADTTYNTFLATLNFTRSDLLSIDVVPVLIPRKTYAPTPVSGERGREILTQLQELCAEHNTELTLVNDSLARVTISAE